MVLDDIITVHTRVRGFGLPPLEFWQKCGYRISEWGWFDIAQHLC